MTFDKRLTPARLDVAAAHLKGKVEAVRFVSGETFRIGRGHVALRAKPSDDAAQETELLFGEMFTVYENKNGWAWGQLAPDDYVGYVRADALVAPGETNARVSALMTPLLSAPDVKSPSKDMLPLNARVAVTERQNRFAEISGGGFIAEAHLDKAASDWVAVAEKFVGVPYVWGGKTQAGLDCSGLIQTSMHAAGLKCPRDTDMQFAALGEVVALDSKLQRGDLVFWKGHVGVMLDEARLLHANAFHNEVAIELLAEAQKRIEAIAGLAIASINRI
jgi:cell wall-associated NlpC family hydrolase